MRLRRDEASALKEVEELLSDFDNSPSPELQFQLAEQAQQLQAVLELKESLERNTRVAASGGGEKSVPELDTLPQDTESSQKGTPAQTADVTPRTGLRNAYGEFERAASPEDSVRARQRVSDARGTLSSLQADQTAAAQVAEAQKEAQMPAQDATVRNDTKQLGAQSNSGGINQQRPVETSLVGMEQQADNQNTTADALTHEHWTEQDLDTVEQELSFVTARMIQGAQGAEIGTAEHEGHALVGLDASKVAAAPRTAADAEGENEAALCLNGRDEVGHARGMKAAADDGIRAEERAESRNLALSRLTSAQDAALPHEETSDALVSLRRPHSRACSVDWAREHPTVSTTAIKGAQRVKSLVQRTSVQGAKQKGALRVLGTLLTVWYQMQVMRAVAQWHCEAAVEIVFSQVQLELEQMTSERDRLTARCVSHDIGAHDIRTKDCSEPQAPEGLQMDSSAQLLTDAEEVEQRCLKEVEELLVALETSAAAGTSLVGLEHKLNASIDAAELAQDAVVAARQYEFLRCSSQAGTGNTKVSQNL